MTRRRIIAGVILLAAVAVAVPLVPGVWRAGGYVQIPILVPVTVESAGDLILDAGTFVVESSMLTVHEKRHAWLPGRAFIVPDQVCQSYEMRNHTLCFPRHMRGARFIMPDGIRVDLPGDFHCTCTDPSHKDKP